MGTKLYSNHILFCLSLQFIFFDLALLYFSNIQEFCGYIKQLPSLDDKILKAKKIHISRKTRDAGEDVYVKLQCVLFVQ